MDRRLDHLIEAASRIGHRIVASGVWDGSTCSWLVTTPDRNGASRFDHMSVQASSGLYQGTAGIALFLAELWKLTGDDEALQCAGGAVREAVRLQQTIGPRLGLYTGSVGITYAGARMTALTGDNEWLDTTISLAEAVVEVADRDTVYDVMGGAAGAILGLLAVEAITDQEKFVGMAVRLAEHLERAARRHVFGWSWPFGRGASQDLCGYSHGASGVAHAFLELFARTGERRWRFAARRALEYERYHAIASTGDWPDFRDAELMEHLQRRPHMPFRRSGDKSSNQRFSVMRAWCHGSPGIALSRIRAVTLAVDPADSDREATLALGATRADLEKRELRNCSLCHGLFGNAESLLVAYEQLGQSELETVSSLASDAASRYELAGKPWLTGVLGAGFDPSLLVGEAGIGHFLLRVANPGVPSVLCLSSWRSAPTGREAEDHDLLGAEIEKLLPLTTRATQCVSAPRPALRCMTAWKPETLSTQAAIDIVKKAIHVAQGTHDGDLLSEAATIDWARLAEDSAFTDYVEQFTRETERKQASEIDWSHATLGLCSSTRLISTHWAWGDLSLNWASLPRRERGCLVVYRAGPDVRLKFVSPVVELLLNLLKTPRTLSELVAKASNEVDIDPGDPAAEAFPAFVADVAREVVKLGIAEVGQVMSTLS